MATNTISGARAIFVLEVNGVRRPVAYASGCNAGEEITYEPVEILGKLAVAEWVPVAYRTNLSGSVFRTMQQGNNTGFGSLKKLGVFPKESEILGVDPFEVILTDRVTRQIISKVEGVKTSGYNFSISARGIVGQDVQFVCTGMKDEAELPLTA